MAIVPSANLPSTLPDPKPCVAIVSEKEALEAVALIAMNKIKNINFFILISYLKLRRANAVPLTALKMMVESDMAGSKLQQLQLFFQQRELLYIFCILLLKESVQIEAFLRQFFCVDQHLRIAHCNDCKCAMSYRMIGLQANR